MPRLLLDEAHIHPAIRGKVAEHEQAIVQEVMVAIRDNDVVVVGMGMNPFPKKARKALDDAGQAYRYLEYGSYLNSWRKRNALKIWSGWPSFPMVFVKSLFTIYTRPRWGAIGMSGSSWRAAWAHAHARAWAAQSPDFTPTRRASALSGGLRRCDACQ